jgi:hypothetical protein
VPLSGPVAPQLLWLATIAGALAALLVALMIARGAVESVRRVVLSVAAVLVGGSAVIVILSWLAQSEVRAEQRALAQRQAELAAQALAPGSPLACLDSAVGEAAENACEHAVFAGPQATAAAVAYRTAQITLLDDALGFASRAEPGFAARFDGLRRSIERDRFGIVAHVLAARDRCTAENCAIFAHLHDAATIKANLKEQAFEQNVTRYAAAWGKPGEAEQPIGGAPAALAAKPLTNGYDYPSAASIPPVSIMNPEPLVPKDTRGEAKPGTEPPLKPATPSAQKQPAAPMALH